MDVIAEIFGRIKSALEQADAIEHVDLWNHNVEFLEQETAWPRPAVFVEFRPIVWDRLKEELMRGRIEVVMHIVTDWSHPIDGMADVWRTADAVAAAIDGMSGERFNALRLTETQINHNHEELVETLELYRCNATRRIRHN